MKYGEKPVYQPLASYYIGALGIVAGRKWPKIRGEFVPKPPRSRSSFAPPRHLELHRPSMSWGSRRLNKGMERPIAVVLKRNKTLSPAMKEFIALLKTPL